MYSFHSIDFDGTNTQYIKLTRDDVKQLRTVLERLQECRRFERPRRVRRSGTAVSRDRAEAVAQQRLA